MQKSDFVIIAFLSLLVTFLYFSNNKSDTLGEQTIVSENENLEVLENKTVVQENITTLLYNLGNRLNLSNFYLQNKSFRWERESAVSEVNGKMLLLDGKEENRISFMQDFFTEKGFLVDSINSTPNKSAFFKEKVVCLIQKVIPENKTQKIEIACGTLN